MFLHYLYAQLNFVPENLNPGRAPMDICVVRDYTYEFKWDEKSMLFLMQRCSPSRAGFVFERKPGIEVWRR